MATRGKPKTKYLIDQHPEKAKIIKDIVSCKYSQQTIADKYGLKYGAVQRYLSDKLAERAAAVMADEERQEGLIILEKIDEIVTKVQKVLDACDEWLTDPTDKNKYFLGPRGSEILITYNDTYIKTVKGEKKVIPIQRKETLDEAMERLRNKGKEVTHITYRNYDIRKLIIDTAQAMTGQLELMAKIKGAIPDIKINITVSQAWMHLKHVIVDATKGAPEIRSKIIDGIKKSGIEG